MIASLVFWQVVLGGTVRLATPVVLAALGEMIAERSGSINLGIDGIMTAGAFTAVAVASVAGWQAGLVAALLVGAMFGGLIAACVLVGRANQIVVGIAIALVATGLTSYLFQLWQPSGHGDRPVPSVPLFPIGPVARIPWIGNALSGQTLFVPLGLALLAATSLLLARTRAGLALRASGDDPVSAALRGIDVIRVRSLGLVAAGALAGLGGSAISLGSIGSFSDGMVAGRGYVAIAVVIIGRWRPLGILLGAILFAFFDSLGLRAQGRFTTIPNEAFAALPYVMTLLVLVLTSRRQIAPRALGKPYPP